MGEMRTVLRPHSSDGHILGKSAEVYARGRTPEITPDGRVAEMDLRPGGPDVAARHVHNIEASFGEAGVNRTLRGLQVTRGNQFVLQMLAVDPGLGGLMQRADRKRRVPSSVSDALHSNRVGEEPPPDVRDQFEGATGHDIRDVQLLNDSQAHEAAASVGARAFTIGQRIFFGRGEYDPGSEPGRELIFHELFHTVQQHGASIPTSDHMGTSSQGDIHERQADAVAHLVAQFGRHRAVDDSGEIKERARGHALERPLPLDTGRVQRVISFGAVSHTPVTNRVVATEDATGFTLGSPVPTFQWEPDVTIHGNAGDPFAEWETAHHQVKKANWMNVFWGTGTDRTHRQQTVTGGMPVRDATALGNTWYSDWRAQGFAADGDVRTPVMRDTPSRRVPWDNPIVGRGGTRGWFNLGLGFVSTLSCRHIPDGTGAGAFRHLGHMHWNFGLDGSFDATQLVGSRVTSSGGAVNTSRMIPGIDVDNRPMHGGPLSIDQTIDTDT